MRFGNATKIVDFNADFWRLVFPSITNTFGARL